MREQRRHKSQDSGECTLWCLLQETKRDHKDNANSLVFPDEKDVERREKVSYEALELMNGLLQEKEYRISSKKYRWNDWQHSTRTPGQLVARRSDPRSQDYKGNFVYTDDASDIKAHPFFNRIAWDRLHLTRPPFVPDISSRDDTKYFDEEEPISDVDDASTQPDSESETSDKRVACEQETASITRTHPSTMGRTSKCDIDADGDATVLPGKGHNPNNKAKKRPRDRVLRDKELKNIALNIRKKGAFLGYTYRRPRFLNQEDGYGKQDRRRRGLMPSFG